MKDVVGEADPFAMVLDLPNEKGQKEIIFDQPDVKPNNAIKDELSTFADAINNDTVPLVTLHDGYSALDVAHKIIEKLMVNSNLMEEA